MRGAFVAIYGVDVGFWAVVVAYLSAVAVHRGHLCVTAGADQGVCGGQLVLRLLL